MKVYEVANELGVGAIDLVEALKSKGLNIRNHMVKLSDEEITIAKSIYNKDQNDAQEKSSSKKVAKKKVAKKKVTKKKVIKKANTTDSDNAAAETSTEVETEKKTKTVVVKKKVVKKVAKKLEGDDQSESNGLAQKESTSSNESNVTHESEQVNLDQEASPVEVKTQEPQKLPNDFGLKGLQVVAPAPEKKVEEKKDDVSSTTNKTSKSKIDEFKQKPVAVETVDDYRKKMHSFTPVFIPEEKTKTSEDKISSNNRNDNYVNSAEDFNFSVDAKDKAKDSKKRLGDLAQTINKKSAVSRPKDISQIRAEEEMKLATKIVGASIYTPIKKKKVYHGETKQTQITQVKGAKRFVVIFGSVSALDLSNKLKVKFQQLRDDVLSLNLLIKKEDMIGKNLAEKIAGLYGYRVEDRSFDESNFIETEKEDKSHYPLRDAVITVMGHVDHGKTTLLDSIRKTKVTAQEAGGITQHLGAYSVTVGDSSLTFLDTPGHAAFSNIRKRGAHITDIVVLVVAADDGPMPQTKESIRFAKETGTPIIVAVNKMDKEGANIDKIKQELTEFELVSEDWGGDTMFVPISALKGDGIDELLEAIKLQAEVMDLREDDKGSAQGVILESRIETGRGPISTLLVQKGTLKKGDTLVCGEIYGRARTLLNDDAKDVKSAGPSVPVQVLGLNGTPSPGEEVAVVKNEREAKKIVDNRIRERLKLESVDDQPKAQVSLEDFFASSTSTGAAEEKKILKLIIKADVQGSAEAIKDSVAHLGNDEVGIDVITCTVGSITDNDIKLASESKAYILGFNMRPVTSARKLSEQLGVEVRTYSIIYELINDVTLALEGMLEPERVERYIGRAEVRETFNIPKIGTIAGCMVIDGKIERGCHMRLLRKERIVFDGKLSTLKRFKDEVKEVSNGYECGMALEGHQNIEVGDLIEAYQLDLKERKLESPSQHL